MEQKLENYLAISVVWKAMYMKKNPLNFQRTVNWEFEDIKPVEGELNMLSNSFVPELLHL